MLASFLLPLVFRDNLDAVASGIASSCYALKVDGRGGGGAVVFVMLFFCVYPMKS